MPDVRVDLNDLATGKSRTATTDAAGHYMFSDVQPGHYRVLSTVSGTAVPTRAVEIDVRSGEPHTVNLTWAGSGGSTSTAAVNTDSLVTAETLPVRTTNANIEHNWNTAMVGQSPETNLVNKNGAMYGSYNLSLWSEAVTTGPGPGHGPAVNGQPPITNNFRVDGIDNNNKVNPGPLVYSPSIHSLQLFQNQSTPVFGHSIGGQQNAVLQTGATNGIHGSVYDYLQNRKLNAVDESAARLGYVDRPRFDQNRLGGSIGLPILPGKMFFLGSFEYIPLGFEAPVDGPAFAPTAAGFQQLAATPAVASANLAVLQSAVAPVGPEVGTIRVGAQNVPVGPVNSLQRGWQNQYIGTGAIDFNIRSRDALHLRFVYNMIDANNAGPALPLFTGASATTALLGSISHEHVFSPSVTNQIRVGYNRWDQSLNSSEFRLSSFPNISIGGEANLFLGPAGLARSTIWNTYQANDTVGVDWRGHSFRFGADVMRYISAIDGVAAFRGNYTYSSLGRYLFDLPPEVLAQRGFGSSYLNDNRTLLTAFVNDNWAVRPGFTLSLGVRYWYDTLPASVTQQELNGASSVPGIVDFGKPHTQTRNFAPNVGFALAPGHSRKTVIRAGFGMQYDALYSANLFSNPPYVPQLGGALVTATSTTNIPGFLARGGLPNPAGNGVSFNNLSPEQARALTSSYTGAQQLPYSMQWNAGIQTTLWRATTLEAKYLGARTVHTPVVSFLNLVSPVSAQNSLPLFYQQPTRAELNALPLTLDQLQSEQSNSLAQYGLTNPITTITNDAKSWYNALAVDVNQRLGSLQLTGSYTWSHLIDESTGTPLDLNFGRIRGDSLYDRRHRVAITGVFDIAPLFRNMNWVRNILANMSIAGTYLYQTEARAPVISNSGAGLTGYGLASPAIINPAGLGTTGSSVSPLFNNSGRVVGYLADNPNARFIASAPGLFATGNRTAFKLDPVSNIDISVVKRFSWRDRWAFELRGDAYNLFNHPQFTGVPVNTFYSQGIGPYSNFLIPGSVGFGDPSLWTSSNSRVLQLALKMTF